MNGGVVIGVARTLVAFLATCDAHYTATVARIFRMAAGAGLGIGPPSPEDQAVFALLWMDGAVNLTVDSRAVLVQSFIASAAPKVMERGLFLVPVPEPRCARASGPAGRRPRAAVTRAHAPPVPAQLRPVQRRLAAAGAPNVES